MPADFYDFDHPHLWSDEYDMLDFHDARLLLAFQLAVEADAGADFLSTLSEYEKIRLQRASDTFCTFNGFEFVDITDYA